MVLALLCLVLVRAFGSIGCWWVLGSYPLLAGVVTTGDGRSCGGDDPRVVPASCPSAMRLSYSPTSVRGRLPVWLVSCCPLPFCCLGILVFSPFPSLCVGWRLSPHSSSGCLGFQVCALLVSECAAFAPTRTTFPGGLFLPAPRTPSSRRSNVLLDAHCCDLESDESRFVLIVI